MAISYLIKKGTFIFDQILSQGYSFDLQPVVLNKSIKADGTIKVIYAQYSNITIKLKFGNLDGVTLKSYSSQFTDGTYTVWNPNTQAYETYNFVVEKGSAVMLSQNNGERYDDYDVLLTKSGGTTLSL